MQVEWNDHTLEVTGDWSGRWLYLAPVYQLWLDDECLDILSGPRLHPRLEALYEDADGDIHHIEAELISIVGLKPECEISVEGDLVASDRVRVENFLNPILVLFILISVLIMFYVGPEVVGQLLPL